MSESKKNDRRATCHSHGGVSSGGALSGTEGQRRGTKSQHVPNVATILGVVTWGIGMLPGVVVQLTADGALSARSPACFFGDDEPSVCCGDGPTIFVAVC